MLQQPTATKMSPLRDCRLKADSNTTRTNASTPAWVWFVVTYSQRLSQVSMDWWFGGICGTERHGSSVLEGSHLSLPSKLKPMTQTPRVFPPRTEQHNNEQGHKTQRKDRSHLALHRNLRSLILPYYVVFIHWSSEPVPLLRLRNVNSFSFAKRLHFYGTKSSPYRSIHLSKLILCPFVQHHHETLDILFRRFAITVCIRCFHFSKQWKILQFTSVDAARAKV